MKKKTWLALAAVAALIAVMAGAYLHFAPKVTVGEKTVTISVAYPDGTREDHEVQTDAEYLKEAAESVLTLEGEEGPYGFTIYAINGVEANFETDAAYWCIYVNGEYGQYAVEAQPVADGDTFLFAYEKTN